MMLTNLADILRAAKLPVVEVDGWKTRSADGNDFAGVQAIICHWTATNPVARGDYPTWNTILHGNGDTPGPLSQLGLGRGGTWYTFAAGVAWHAGKVDHPSHDNYHALGIEAEYHPDQGAWPEVQQRSYERGCAALAKAFNVPVRQIQGHYEVARPIGRKSDPNTLPGGMPGFRQRVSVIINGQQEDDVTPEDIEAIAEKTRDLLLDQTPIEMPQYGGGKATATLRVGLGLLDYRTQSTNAKVDAVKVGGIDYDLLADKVADRLASRLAQ